MVDEELRKRGMAALAAVERLVKTAEALPINQDGSLVLDPLDDGEELAPGETDRYLRKNLLAAVGAIEVTRGYGGPARRVDEGAREAVQVILAARCIWEAICAAGDGYLSPERLEQLERSAERLERATWVLKGLQLVTGRRRAGGLQLAQAADRQIQEAADREGQLERQAEPEKGSERQHEDVLYDSAADLLDRAYGIQSVVLGNKQLAEGQWNTPDVAGFYVKPAGPGGLPVLRVMTVEVKWRLTRDAIAEAASHRRFASYAYLFVPGSFSELDPELVTECMQAGIGLMCARQANSQRYYVQIEPPLNRPDEEWVDYFLATFRDKSGEPLAQRVSREVRKALAAIIAGA